MTALNIAIAGATGRMGKSLVTATLEAGHTISGASTSPYSTALGRDLGTLIGRSRLGVTVKSTHDAVAAGANVWIDFTTPKATCLALQHLAETKVAAIIIGTTGFSATDEKKIARAASRFTIVKSDNFSLGVAILTSLVHQTANRLGEDWDVDILDTHHRHKVDAPSGTALALGHAAAHGRGKPFAALRAEPYCGTQAKRRKGSIGFATRRGGGTIGVHDVTFSSEKETLTLGHTALDRTVFAHGAVKAAEWAVTQHPGLYSLNDVLDLPV